MIIELEKFLQGSGNVSGIKYTQIYFCNNAFLYSCMQNGIITHFEVFERKLVPLCVDFEKKIYSDVDFKEIFPKDKDFGNWAWTYKSLFEAEKKYQEIQARILNELNKTQDYERKEN